MCARSILTLAFTLALPAVLPAQVTHGQKPKLPAPFATNSAGNGPDKTKPPAGFLPTVPSGFRVNIYATNFKEPRWLIVAPNGDIFFGRHWRRRSNRDARPAKNRRRAGTGNLRRSHEAAVWNRFPRELRVRRKHKRSGALSLRSENVEAAG